MDGHWLLAGLWIAYGALHSLLAARRVKAWIAGQYPRYFRRYRLFYTVFAFLSLVAVIAYQLWLPTPLLFAGNGLSLAGGVLLGGAGLVVMGLCIRRYFLQLSGLMTIFENPVKSGNTLLVTGLHRYVRHPLYLGTFAAIWGAFLLLPYLSFLLSNLIITAYTLFAIRFEEEKLVAEFGADYLRYREKVPAIIPGLHSGRQD
ncbi:MAG TPA: methyltransferase [Chitinophagaceae bacterium]|jgi:protein-S-isoprenylcysteine O-methyltransferase Ste14|nr:methyltransferase [Chitinophagaceae bacterium]